MPSFPNTCRGAIELGRETVPVEISGVVEDPGDHHGHTSRHADTQTEQLVISTT